MRRTLIARSAADTEDLGRRLGERAPAAGVLTLTGPLGAGKTVLAQGVLAGLGVPGPHPSPTYTIVRRYERTDGGPVWHVDAYRLGGPEELGWDEVLAGDALVLVEWPAALADLLPRERLDVSLARTGEGEARRVELDARGEGARAWLARAADDGTGGPGGDAATARERCRCRG